MEISYDSAKNERNIAERGLSFEWALAFNFETALFRIDHRHAYPEARIHTFRLIGERLYMLVFSETQAGIRVISLRKANKREVKRYEEAIQP